MTSSRRPRRRPTAAQAHRAVLRANRHLYEPLLKLQGGGCAICKAPPRSRKLDMDHDHKTMAIRGLLCIRCNRCLRSWMSATWLRKAADYLDNPPRNQLGPEYDPPETEE